MQHLYWSGGKDSWFVLAIYALEVTLQKGWGEVGENQQTGQGKREGRGNSNKVAPMGSPG